MNKKNTLVILALLFLIISIIPEYVNAGIFDVGVTVTNTCIPEWHCTIFSEDSCGTRECVDIYSCGTNVGKPEELVECEDSSSSSGWDDSDETETSADILLSQFKLSSDIVRIDVTPGKEYIRLIKVSSEKDNSNPNLNNYHISLSSSSEEFLKLVSLSKDSFSGDGEFEIIINPKSELGIVFGVYSGHVVIENSYYSKNIPVIINILSQGPEFSINLSNILIVDKATILSPLITLKDANSNSTANETYNITYVLLSSQGEELFSFSSSKYDGSLVTLPMPVNLKRGYYILAVTVSSQSGKRTEYSTIYADPEHELSPYVEEAKSLAASDDTLERRTGFFAVFGAAVFIIILFSIYIFITKTSQSENSSAVQHSSAVKSSSISEGAYSRIMRDVYERGFITESEYDGFTGKKHHEKSVDMKKHDMLRDSMSDISNKCPEGKEFILHDGKKISSIKELLECISNMSEDTFFHHVNQERNDFAKWIRDVFKKEELASKIQSCHGMDEMKQVLKSA
ncbi:MAG: DUF5752 family protein [Candidatus Woesearchaeota archaeon]